MSNPQQHSKPASKQQLALLRTLAAERAQSFAYPQNSMEADAEIKRLKRERRLSYADRRREDRDVGQAMRRGGDAAAVGPEELSGYGSTAGWK